MSGLFRVLQRFLPWAFLLVVCMFGLTRCLTPPTMDGVSCNLGRDCGADYRCDKVEKVCRKNRCQKDSDCGNGKCVDSTCVGGGEQPKTCNAGDQCVKVFAGSCGNPGSDNGPLLNAKFRGPHSIVAGEGGALYVSDAKNHCIRKIEQGVVTTLAGTCNPDLQGFKDGSAKEAKFHRPTGMLLTSSGVLLIADTGNHRIREFRLPSKPLGDRVTTLVGDGENTSRDGPLRVARLNAPTGLAQLGENDWLVAESGGHKIRRITLGGIVGVTGEAKTVAGSIEGDQDGNAEDARFKRPGGIWKLKGDTFLIADWGNSKLKTLSLSGSSAAEVKTVVGSEKGSADGDGVGAKVSDVHGFAILGKLTYFSDTSNHLLRTSEGSSYKVKTVSDKNTPQGKGGFVDGLLSKAQFGEPKGLLAVGSKLYIVDSLNHCIRVMETK